MTCAFIPDIVQNHTISDVIFSCLSPASLFRFARTARGVHDASQGYIRRAFDINKHLARFFASPRAFRALQARTGLVVSGSSALQFLDRTFYPGSDLDVYAFKRHARAAGEFFRAAGYAFAPNSVQDPEWEVAMTRAETLPREELAGDEEYLTESAAATQGVHTVFTFLKKAEREELKVQLIVALKSPMQIIYHFHTTCVMNIITHNSAHSLFPRATFEHRRALVTGKERKNAASAMVKYTQRGWTIARTLSLNANDEPDAHPFGAVPGYRWVDDRHAWTLALPTDGVAFPRAPAGAPYLGPAERIPVAPAALSGFGVNVTEYGRVELRYTTLHSAMLEYSYTLPHEQLGTLLVLQLDRFRQLAYATRNRVRLEMDSVPRRRMPETKFDDETLDTLVPGLVALVRRQFQLY